MPSMTCPSREAKIVIQFIIDNLGRQESPWFGKAKHFLEECLEVCRVCEEMRIEGAIED